MTLLFSKKCDGYKNLFEVFGDVEKIEDNFETVHENLEEDIDAIEESFQEKLQNVTEEVQAEHEAFEEEIEDTINETKSSISLLRILAVTAVVLGGLGVIVVAIVILKGCFMAKKIEEAMDYGRGAKKTIESWITKYKKDPKSALETVEFNEK